VVPGVAHQRDVYLVSIQEFWHVEPQLDEVRLASIDYRHGVAKLQFLLASKKSSFAATLS